MMQINQVFLKSLTPFLHVLIFKIIPFIIKTPTQSMLKTKNIILKFLLSLIDNAAFFLQIFDIGMGKPLVRETVKIIGQLC